MFKIQRTISLLLAATLSLTVTGMASANDSVYSWGTWELGIEPAAGGPIPGANRPLRVQQKTMQFRPNDNAAFTRASSNSVTMTTSGGNPTTPPITPVAPGATLGPSGGPAPTGDPRGRN